MTSRTPEIFEFSEKQSQIMGKFGCKKSQTVRGPTNIAAANELIEAGILKAKNTENGYPGLTLFLTSKGREAWYNFCLKAAGRSPICLD